MRVGRDFKDHMIPTPCHWQGIAATIPGGHLSPSLEANFISSKCQKLSAIYTRNMKHKHLIIWKRDYGMKTHLEDSPE